MKLRIGMLTAVAAASLVLFPLGAALASGITVSPNTVFAGRSVTVKGSCAPNLHTSGEASSSVFVHDASHESAGVGAVFFHTKPNGKFSLSAHVRSNAAAGVATVSVQCGGRWLGSSTFTVKQHHKRRH